jgi:hypothetical protein
MGSGLAYSFCQTPDGTRLYASVPVCNSIRLDYEHCRDGGIADKETCSVRGSVALFDDSRTTGVKFSQQNSQKRRRASRSGIQMNLFGFHKACPARDHHTIDLSVAGDADVIHDRRASAAEDFKHR